MQGHYQVIFSRQHCPLFQRKLGLMMKVLYCSGVWSYIVASIATPTFILVPLGTIWIGIFPIVLSWWAALGLSVYYVATTMVPPRTFPPSPPTLLIGTTFECLM